jgi:hypothetical protein
MQDRVLEFVCSLIVAVPLQAAWCWYFGMDLGAFVLGIWVAVCISMAMGVIRRGFAERKK